MSVQPLQPPQNALYNDQGQRVKVDRAQYNLRWGEIWDANLKPGQLFDASASSPVLNHALEVDVGNLEGKRALVPGCGCVVGNGLHTPVQLALTIHSCTGVGMIWQP